MLFRSLVQEGIPFRTTHKITGQLVQTASNSKKSLSKLTPSEIKKSISDTKVDSKLLSKIIKSVSISSSLQDRVSLGSSGFEEQSRMIEDRISKINDLRNKVTKRDNDITNSLENLTTKVKELIK